MIFTAAFLSFPYISSYSFFETQSAFQNAPLRRVYLSGEWIEYIILRYFMSSTFCYFFYIFLFLCKRFGALLYFGF